MARVGLGPVFAFEWLTASRRWQAYGLRSLTVLLLFVPLMLAWSAGPVAGRGEATIAESAEIGKTFYEITSVVLLGLVGLTAPAATAGAICLDKARGSLALLMATDLSDAEIVLGKLAARLVPVFGMILCAAPVMALATLFGGIDPIRLVGALFVVLACAIFGCALALTLSVWGSKTHEVLLTTYVFGILYLLAAPISVILREFFPAHQLWWLPSFGDILAYNPIFLVLAAVNGPPGLPTVTLATQARFFALGLAASTVLIAVAVWRIRPVVIGQLGRSEARRAGAGSWSRWLGRIDPGRALRRVWLGPSLDANPVLWRECRRRLPSRWTRVVWGLYALVCGGFSVLGIAALKHDPEPAAVVNAAQVGAGLLLLSVSAATSLAEERQRGSLDVLLATPLSTRSIVWGKWWGTFRGVPPLLILPMIVATVMAYRAGNLWGVPLLMALILAYGAGLTSLGLALATWMPRPSRAVGLTVGLYVLMTLGWIPFSFLVFESTSDLLSVGVAAGSPLVGVGAFCDVLGGGGAGEALWAQTFFTLGWTLVYAVLAALLRLLATATFDDCLGRLGDSRRQNDDEGNRDAATARLTAIDTLPVAASSTSEPGAPAS